MPLGPASAWPSFESLYNCRSEILDDVVMIMDFMWSVYCCKDYASWIFFFSIKSVSWIFGSFDCCKGLVSKLGALRVGCWREKGGVIVRAKPQEGNNAWVVFIFIFSSFNGVVAVVYDGDSLKSGGGGKT